MSEKKRGKKGLGTFRMELEDEKKLESMAAKYAAGNKSVFILKAVRYGMAHPDKIFGAALLLLICLVPRVQAGVPEDKAVKAIVGEAEGESLKGKTAVAEAIRNRGSLEGVVGLNSPRVKKAKPWVYRDARKAWKDSTRTNLVKGATHWESTDFPRPSWTDEMEQTTRVGKHRFYKPNRRRIK